jgi:hypothetical protein
MPQCIIIIIIIIIIREYILSVCTIGLCGPGSSVSIAPGYGLDRPGIESRWGEISHTCPDRLWGPPSLLYDG